MHPKGYILALVIALLLSVIGVLVTIGIISVFPIDPVTGESSNFLVGMILIGIAALINFMVPRMNRKEPYYKEGVPLYKQKP